MQVLLVHSDTTPIPAGTAGMLAEIGCEVAETPSLTRALEAAREHCVDAVVVPAPSRTETSPDEAERFVQLLRTLETQRIAGVVLSDHAEGEPSKPDSLVEFVPRNISLPELRGRMATIDRYHRMLRRVEGDLDKMERLGKRINEHFQALNQEMGLAGRLQRDFLPSLAKPILNARFAAIYRPASWVSGDMFDVFRIDEHHTGFYLADAVGHGMAASLLTMFIKRAIVPKRIDGEAYTVRSPSETIASLNDALAAQDLPNCQFVTACYAILDHRSLELRYARGGHPYPILLGADGQVAELRSAGGLLGLDEGEEFPTATTQLAPGDKVILYTDGLEAIFDDLNTDVDNDRPHLKAFAPLAGLSIHDLTARLEARLDDQSESNQPDDDVTVVGLEIIDG